MRDKKHPKKDLDLIVYEREEKIREHRWRQLAPKNYKTSKESKN